MGWGNCGTDSRGRPIGYNFSGFRDHPGCGKKINRGLSYACGDMHGAGAYYCEGYFCEEHRTLVVTPEGEPISICLECANHLVIDDDLNIVEEKETEG
jgi:hypothetical protein